MAHSSTRVCRLIRIHISSVSREKCREKKTCRLVDSLPLGERFQLGKSRQGPSQLSENFLPFVKEVDLIELIGSPFAILRLEIDSTCDEVVRKRAGAGVGREGEGFGLGRGRKDGDVGSVEFLVDPGRRNRFPDL